MTIENISHYRILANLDEEDEAVVYKSQQTGLGWVMVLILFLFLYILTPQFCLAQEGKTGRVVKDTLIDDKFGYQLKVSSDWEITVEKEPSLERSKLIRKSYPKEDLITPTVTILADTTSLSLQAIEDCLIKGGGGFKKKNDYLEKLDVLHTYKLVKTNPVTVDSVQGKIYGLRKFVTEWHVGQVSLSGSKPSTSQDTQVRRADGTWVTLHSSPGRGSKAVNIDNTRLYYVFGAVVILKKGNSLYIIQLSAGKSYFWAKGKEFDEMIYTWKFLK